MELKEIIFIADWLLNAVIIIAILWSKIRTGVGINKLNTVLEEHVEVDKMKAQIHERLEVVTVEGLKYVRGIEQEYIDMLGAVSERFEDFAINSYFSKYRKSKSIEFYLNIKAGGLLTIIDNLFLQVIPEKKKGKFITEFAKSGGIAKEVDLLKRALIKNGLTSNEYVDLFEDTVKRVLHESIELYQDWKEIN